MPEPERPGLTPRQGAALFLLALAVVVLAGWPTPFTLPTYWDGTLGPVTQAVWLAENDFDFPTLLRDLPGYHWGGPRVYTWSIYPPFLAAVMRWTGSPTGFLVVLHTLHYLLAAGCVLAVADLVRRRVPAAPIWLAPALLLTQPFFLTQATAVNLEMPVLGCAFLALRAFWREREPEAALWLLAGTAVKMSVAPLALATAAAFALGRLRRPADAVRVAALAAPFLLLEVLGRVEDLLAHLPRGDEEAARWELVRHPSAWLFQLGVALGRTPDLILAALGLLGAAVGLLLRAARAPRGAPERRPDVTLAVWLGVGTSLLLLLQVALPRMLPRYTFSFFPLLVVGFLLLGQRLRRPLWLGLGLAWIGFNLLNLGGAGARAVDHFLRPRLYGHPPPPAEHVPNNGHLLERSFEFRADLRLQRRVAALLQEHYADKVVVTSWPMLHQVMKPWFGYVREPLRALASHRPGMQWAGAESYWEMRKREPRPHGLNPGDFVWVWTPNAFSFPPPNLEEARLLHEVEEGGRRAVLFTHDTWPEIPEWALRPLR